MIQYHVSFDLFTFRVKTSALSLVCFKQWPNIDSNTLKYYSRSIRTPLYWKFYIFFNYVLYTYIIMVFELDFQHQQFHSVSYSPSIASSFFCIQRTSLLLVKFPLLVLGFSRQSGLYSLCSTYWPSSFHPKALDPFFKTKYYI